MMLDGRKLAGGCLALGLAMACGSDEEDSSNGPFGVGELPPDSEQVLITPGTGGTGGGIIPGNPQYTGGIQPLPAGGLDELRDEACTGWNASPEPMPVVLMLVVDVSNSMNDEPPGSNRSKWEITRDALSQAIDELPATAAVGVLYFPNMRTDEYRQEVATERCVNTDELLPIDVLGAAGSDHRAAIERSLGRVTVIGGTPTYEAYTYALEELRGTGLPGNRYMLLITDGQPTYGVGCIGNGRAEDATPAYITPVVDAVQGAYADGMGTFVIGSPGSESSSEVGEDMRPWLSEAAEAGGTGFSGCVHTGPNYCHFDMVQEADFGAGLTRALAEISGTIVGCDYTMPAPPPGETLDPNAVNVVLTTGTGEQFLVLRDDGADCTQGWHYVDNGTRIELCPETCDDVEADPDASLELLFGCATVTGPVE
jgi:hypothetical protein